MDNLSEIEMLQEEVKNIKKERERELEREIENQIYLQARLKQKYDRDRKDNILIERFMRLLRGRRISEETYQILRLELEHNREYREYREYEKVELGSEAMKQQYMNHFNVDFDGSMWHNNSRSKLEEKKEPFISEKEMNI